MEKLLETEQDRIEFKLWLEALESGNYKQTKRCLQDDVGYCCLGVACFVTQKELRLRPFWTIENQEIMVLDGHYPDAQPNAPEWLRKVNVDFENRYSKGEGKEGMTLSYLNDNVQTTFPEIAALLRTLYAREL